MQTRTLPTRRLAGVEVSFDLSIVVLVVLVGWAFTSLFRGAHDLPVAVGMAAIGAVLVVLTTLAHELGHALEARSRGIRVEGITLLLFGGVTELHVEGQSARDELAVAAVGPWISLVCAAGFGLLATFADVLVPATAAGPVAEVAGVLGWWNLLLAAFNLVPGAPLDGGRVLRALLWMLTGDRLRALRISVRAGQLLGVAVILFGLVVLVRGGPRATLVVAAFVLSGVFLLRAATTELRHAELNAVLDGRRVVDLLALPATPTPSGPPGPPADALEDDLEDDLPTVEDTDDLYTLIDAFQGDHTRVRILRDGRTLAAVSEGEVARAIAQLRRAGKR